MSHCKNGPCRNRVVVKTVLVKTVLVKTVFVKTSGCKNACVMKNGIAPYQCVANVIFLSQINIQISLWPQN